MKDSVRIRGLLAIVTLLAAWPAPAANDNVYGSIAFQLTDWQQSGWGAERLQLEMERHNVFPDPTLDQIAKIDIDLPGGTIRGFHAAEAQSIQTTTTIGQIQPALKVVAPVGASQDATVLLDLRVTLDASFGAGLFSEMNTYAVNTFIAELAPYFSGAPPAAWRARATYDYYWRRDVGGDDLHHWKSSQLNPFGCAGCIAEVIVPDPLNEFAAGFRDITLRVAFPILPDWEFIPALRIVGQSSVSSHGAFGHWMDTARIGYVLPEGYALAMADGTLLDGWNLSPVPEPGRPALLAAGLGLLAVAVRRRRRHIAAR